MVGPQMFGIGTEIGPKFVDRNCVRDVSSETPVLESWTEISAPVSGGSQTSCWTSVWTSVGGHFGPSTGAAGRVHKAQNEVRMKAHRHSVSRLEDPSFCDVRPVMLRRCFAHRCPGVRCAAAGICLPMRLLGSQKMRAHGR